MSRFYLHTPVSNTSGLLTALEGDARYVLSGFGAGGGVTAHGVLTGLDEDHHTQYYNQARGDARYLLSGLYETSGTSYTKTESDTNFQSSGLYALTSHNHDTAYLASGLYELSGTSYTKTESNTIYELSGYVQSVDSEFTATGTYTLAHNMNRYPLTIVLISGAGGKYEQDLTTQHINTNTVKIFFAGTITSGLLICR